jgi:hypothetical protein
MWILSAVSCVYIVLAVSTFLFDDQANAWSCRLWKFEVEDIV